MPTVIEKKNIKTGEKDKKKKGGRELTLCSGQERNVEKWDIWIIYMSKIISHLFSMQYAFRELIFFMCKMRCLE